MLRHNHRLSRDIDIFLPDPQVLAYLSPRMGGETLFGAIDYDETAHHLKLRFPEGEIDFIAKPHLTPEPVRPLRVGDHDLPVETSAEIATKKLHNRGEYLLPRDVFDIAVVTRDDPGSRDVIRGALVEQEAVLRKRMQQLEALPAEALADLMRKHDIFPARDEIVPVALDAVRELVDAIPRREDMLRLDPALPRQDIQRAIARLDDRDLLRRLDATRAGAAAALSPIEKLEMTTGLQALRQAATARRLLLPESQSQGCGINRGVEGPSL